jgi:Ca-activated chloride channel family protein
VPLQAQSTRNLYVTVSDPLNRFVTGLEREHFEVVQNGVGLPITAIADAESPITIAVVSEVPLQPS